MQALLEWASAARREWHIRPMAGVLERLIRHREKLRAFYEPANPPEGGDHGG